MELAGSFDHGVGGTADDIIGTRNGYAPALVACLKRRPVFGDEHVFELPLQATASYVAKLPDLAEVDPATQVADHRGDAALSVGGVVVVAEAGHRAANLALRWCQQCIISHSFISFEALLVVKIASVCQVGSNRSGLISQVWASNAH